MGVNIYLTSPLSCLPPPCFSVSLEPSLLLGVESCLGNSLRHSIPLSVYSCFRGPGFPGFVLKVDARHQKITAGHVTVRPPPPLPHTSLLGHVKTPLHCSASITSPLSLYLFSCVFFLSLNPSSTPPPSSPHSLPFGIVFPPLSMRPLCSAF